MVLLYNIHLLVIQLTSRMVVQSSLTFILQLLTQIKIQIIEMLESDNDGYVLYTVT